MEGRRLGGGNDPSGSRLLVRTASVHVCVECRVLIVVTQGEPDTRGQYYGVKIFMSQSS